MKESQDAGHWDQKDGQEDSNPTPNLEEVEQNGEGS